jgi:hypothetical protein
MKIAPPPPQDSYTPDAHLSKKIRIAKICQSSVTDYRIE